MIMTREEQLNEAVFDYVGQSGTTIEWGDGWEDFNDAEYVEKAFKAGAEWEYKRLVEKACDWLVINAEDSAESALYLVAKFKRAMEE